MSNIANGLKLEKAAQPSVYKDQLIVHLKWMHGDADHYVEEVSSVTREWFDNFIEFLETYYALSWNQRCDHENVEALPL